MKEMLRDRRRCYVRIIVNYFIDHIRKEFAFLCIGEKKEKRSDCFE